MTKDFIKAIQIYVIAHVGLLIFYYFIYMYLKLQEKTPFEISKDMFITVSVANLLVYFVSNQWNQEKREAQQIHKSYILYSLFIFEIFALVGVCYLYIFQV